MQPASCDRAAIVDEFGELRRRIAESKLQLQPTLERADALESQILSWYEHEPPDQSFVADGHRYSVQVGARHWERKITGLRRLFRFLGQRRFLDLCTFPLKSIDKAIPEVEQSQFVEKTRTGPRSLKPVARTLSFDSIREERLAA